MHERYEHAATNIQKDGTLKAVIQKLPPSLPAFNATCLCFIQCDTAQVLRKCLVKKQLPELQEEAKVLALDTGPVG